MLPDCGQEHFHEGHVGGRPPVGEAKVGAHRLRDQLGHDLLKHVHDELGQGTEINASKDASYVLQRKRKLVQR